MVKPDNALHELQALRGPKGPSFGQHCVVDVLQAQAGHFAKNVQRIEHFLKVHQTDVPGTILLCNHRTERRSSSTVASAGVEVKEVYSKYAVGTSNKIRHYCFIPTSFHC